MTYKGNYLKNEHLAQNCVALTNWYVYKELCTAHIVIVILMSLIRTVQFLQSLFEVVRMFGVWQAEEQWNNWFLCITLVFHLIWGSKATVLAHMPHLHLQAPFIMISCSLAHVQLVNLFALDQRKFPRGCLCACVCVCFLPPPPLESQPYLLEIVCLCERELVLMLVLLGCGGFISFH